MATGGLATSRTASSLESARGGDGDSVTDFAVAADSDVDLVAALMVVGSQGADSMAGRDLEIGLASPTVADSVTALPAVEVAASQAAAFMAVVAASTEAVDFTVAVEAASMAVAVVDSTAVAVVDSTAVAADMAVATGN